jgi:hypothetical protein
MAWLMGLLVALIPHFLLLPPTRRVCEKLGVASQPWLLGVAACPAVALAVLARQAKQQQGVSTQLSTKLFITAAVIQGLFILAGFVIAFS